MSSSGPRHPSRNPTSASPYSSTPLRTTARMTALRPGQSPPPVSIPIRIGAKSYAAARPHAWPVAYAPMARRSRPGLRAIAAAAVVGAVAAGAAVQRRHLTSIARDPEYRRLRAPLGGRPLRVTSADGTELYAEVFGPEDGDTVVLAHGWTEQISFWGLVIGRLRDQDLRVVAYDLRGHGRSARASDGDYALERFGEDLEAVLAATGAGAEREPATVVGHSLGAMSIAAWAE